MADNTSIIIDNLDDQQDITGLRSDISEANDIATEIMEIHDQLSLNIILRNIVYSFTNPGLSQEINYIEKFKNSYMNISQEYTSDLDGEIMYKALTNISDVIFSNLKDKFGVEVSDIFMNYKDNNVPMFLEYLTYLYNFFVVRRYENIRDYFWTKFNTDKIKYIDRYKLCMEKDKAAQDIFVQQDTKKYLDIGVTILINYIMDIIADIREDIENTGSTRFFLGICDTDRFEEVNYNIANMINSGNLLGIDEQLSVKKYLSILDDDEIFVNLRNEILSRFIENETVTEQPF